ncbi:hypothetical protein CANARDRAFT_176818 [[Candida] arabinofermentans NRRL YB-2248]|uniref:4'-phosphopantetheinyl transferase domain-containing protein n=1 Tax=[Candida] arabinofermentans NRRL YB-2248 TaxID=983967 RepID=A0A1E4SYP9_9ASCO|nr:hypothetical protein CANARDRAFT_176818 [[Candida] arabinofermentans NRRL YB-2248]
MSRIIAIGTDLHKVTRFSEILTRNGLNSFKTKRLSQKILNPKYELPNFEKNLNENNLNKCVSILSGSWCVKEAIFKTLDFENQKNFKMSDWFKINNLNGLPIIGNENYMKLTLKEEEFLVSISHDGDYIISTVLRQIIK